VEKLSKQEVGRSEVSRLLFIKFEATVVVVVAVVITTFDMDEPTQLIFFF